MKPLIILAVLFQVTNVFAKGASRPGNGSTLFADFYVEFVYQIGVDPMGNSRIAECARQNASRPITTSSGVKLGTIFPFEDAVPREFYSTGRDKAKRAKLELCDALLSRSLSGCSLGTKSNWIVSGSSYYAAYLNGRVIFTSPLDTNISETCEDLARSR